MLIWITFLAVAVAMAAVGLAWLTVREERRRSDARVASLMAADVAGDGDGATWLEWPPPEPGAVPAEAGAMWAESHVPAEVRTPAEASAIRAATGATTSPRTNAPARGLFGSSDDTSPSPRRLGPVAIGVAVFAVAIAGLLAAGRSSAPASASEAAPAPALELVALSHARQAGELTITGLVRNPPSGAPLEAASAVVLLFDDKSRFVATARAPLEVKRLAPGEASPFRVTTAAPPDLGRYRVSFRREEGGIVPHVDRRAAPDLAPSAGTPRAPGPPRRAGL